MKTRATCQDLAALLNDYVEQTLPAAQRPEIDAHLRGCTACREAVRRAAAVRGLFKGAFGPELIGHATDTSKRLREVTTGPQTGVPYEEDEPVAPAPAGFLDELSQRFGAAPWWTISGAFHGLLILLLFLIGMAIMQIQKADTVILTSLEKRPEEKPPEDVKQTDIIPNPVPVEMPEVSEQPQVVFHEEVEIAEHNETDDQAESHEAFGDEGISDIPLGGSGFSGAIGVGGGASGAFGRPTGAGGRLARAMRGGGNKATESAVDLALEWLARHQEPDGHWDPMKYQSSHKSDQAETGLATLAFLGAGHTDKVGKYKDNVQRALKWLISCQEPDGHLNKGWRPGYNHPIAALALAEAFGMSRSDWLKEPAQKAVDYSVDIHQEGAGTSERGGWRYKAKEPGDVSITCWFTMQLKSAKVAGLHVDPAAFDGASRFFDRIQSKDKAKKGEATDSYFPAHRYGYTNPSPQKQERWPVETMLGCTSRVYLGIPAEELEPSVRWAAETHGYPAWGQHQQEYYWYYGTMVSFQVGGDHWKKWNEALKNTLLPKQRKDGDERGSWDPAPTDYGNYGHSSRVFTTAIGALCLEVYYRYLPVYR